MLGTILKNDTRGLFAQLRQKAERFDGPARDLAWLAFRGAYPLMVALLPLFMALSGSFIPAFVALIAGIFLLSHGFSRSKAQRRIEAAAGILFCLAIACGLPGAIYRFDTEPCLGAAKDLVTGDVRSLSDPRLSARDRAWIERTQAQLAASWPQRGLPGLDLTTLANIVVQARSVATEIAWRGTGPLTRLGLVEAKQAFAALHFDRRKVCALYGRGDRAYGLHLIDPVAERIATATDRALAMILPALQATYIEGAAGVSLSAFAEPSPQ